MYLFFNMIVTNLCFVKYNKTDLVRKIMIIILYDGLDFTYMYTRSIFGKELDPTFVEGIVKPLGSCLLGSYTC